MTQAQQEELWSASLDDLAVIYAGVWEANDREIVRDFILHDRFFLLTQVLGVESAWHPWVLERCREVEREPDERLDLWSRGHYKSTIITYAGTIQEILRNPEICICIMSFKASAAEVFSRQIMTAFEQNEILLDCFPDILWADANEHKGPVWSVGGWNVKRRNNRKENTLNTSGLVSGMRTGGHFDLLIYDDTVTIDSVVTPEMSERTTGAWSMSLNLGVTGRTRHWYIGTRYAIYDTYAEMMKRGIRERRHVCHDGNGEPVLLPKDEYERKKREMSAKEWASQMEQTPIGEGELVFSEGWLCFYGEPPPRRSLNIYTFVDTATRRGKRNDYTVMATVGLAADGNYYLLDLIRDKLSLSQRADAIFETVETWNPQNVFWEANGSRADGEYLRERMERVHWRFRITEIEQTLPKDDRIRWLEPPFREGRVWLPRRLLRQTAAGEVRDNIADFIREEYAIFPSVTHDDTLDCLANVKHPDVQPLLRFPTAPRDGIAADTRNASMRTRRGFRQ